MQDVRAPAVAGAFYPGDGQQLKATIINCNAHEYGPRGGRLDPVGAPVVGAVCPHAGYAYSGPVACNSMAALESEQARRRASDTPPSGGGRGPDGGSAPPLYIMVGPNHRGVGAATATAPGLAWSTPLGDVAIDQQASAALASESGGMARPDLIAHAEEHSLEVQVPMLQEFVGRYISILPVLMADQSRETAERLGRALARVAAGVGSHGGGLNNPAALIASSDFTHYEPNAAAHEKDGELIKAILAMDVDMFYRVLEERRVSACGYGAMAATMVACADLGATEGRLLRYATSFDVAGGDESSVVGYASVVFCR